MKTKAICSFFVLFAIVAGIGATTPAAFAEVTITPAEGSSVPGCEETNECWTPSTVTVDVGGKVIFSNTDFAMHTFTAGTVEDNVPTPSGEFDSSFIMPDDSFEYTADTVGEIPFYCTVHAWMQGVLIVQEAAAEEEVMEEAMMSGVYLGLDIDPMLPFDNTVNDMVTLSFTAKSDELKGTEMTSTIIDHLDYKVMISKDGNEVWTSEVFHDHDGNLELQITPSEGTFTRTEAEEVGSSETKAYMISGPVFMDNGDYQISAQIVGIEFNPLPTPLTDDFSIQVVPEFGSIVMVVFVVAIVGTIAFTTKSRVMPKL
ncbi:MAG: PEFG-CTERM sorting domain-containing protein [Thaumarchaeota archaeon]|nr:PEFG-CTERM sorting domain-containing protein [Nitrososphaerota archaeon]